MMNAAFIWLTEAGALLLVVSAWQFARGKLRNDINGGDFSHIEFPQEQLQMTGAHNALGCVREVYGVRTMPFDEAKQTVRWNITTSVWPETISPGCCAKPAWIYPPQEGWFRKVNQGISCQRRFSPIFFAREY
jgi:hypothetical protein